MDLKSNSTTLWPFKVLFSSTRSWDTAPSRSTIWNLILNDIELKHWPMQIKTTVGYNQSNRRFFMTNSIAILCLCFLEALESYPVIPSVYMLQLIASMCGGGGNLTKKNLLCEHYKVWPKWIRGTGGRHSGAAHLHNSPRLNKILWPPRHFGRSSWRQNCGKHPIVFTSGLEIEFYPILTLIRAL